VSVAWPAAQQAPHWPRNCTQPMHPYTNTNIAAGDALVGEARRGAPCSVGSPGTFGARSSTHCPPAPQPTSVLGQEAAAFRKERAGQLPSGGSRPPGERTTSCTANGGGWGAMRWAAARRGASGVLARGGRGGSTPQSTEVAPPCTPPAAGLPPLQAAWRGRAVAEPGPVTDQAAVHLKCDGHPCEVGVAAGCDGFDNHGGPHAASDRPQDRVVVCHVAELAAQPACSGMRCGRGEERLRGLQRAVA
jgi:hypothetical protein